LLALIAVSAEILRRNVLFTWQGSRNAVGMRVGSELKAARKKAGLTVEVISKRTKISVSKLVALEKNDFKNLPTGLYLFSAVRAYAREVRIDSEPIVERLRAEFADKDALDALKALDAAGALNAKTASDARSSNQERSTLLRNTAIAAGVVLMAAGAGAAAYLHNGRVVYEVAHEVRGETPSASASPAAPATTVVTPVEVPQQAAPAARPAAPAKKQRTKSRPAAVVSALQDTTAPIEDPAVTPAIVEEPRSESPDPAAAP
jgi:cytoskeleton protein RodZ